MTNTKASVDVFIYDPDTTMGIPQSWVYDGTLTLVMIERNHAHPAAIQVLIPGVDKTVVCNADSLIEAVDWMRKVIR